MFKPKQVLFEKGARDYKLGEELYQYFMKEKDIPVYEVATNRVKSTIEGDTLYEMYRNGKRTLVVGVKKSLKFQSCKPSAHYQLPLVSGCMGQCEYCYLNTQLGDKPYVRVHVNIEDILGQAEHHISERRPEITIFEGAATSDPLPVEPYTHALETCIRFFAEKEYGRFRFVSKFTDVDGLLDLEHRNHTEIRFSLNTQTVIKMYEHDTAGADARIKAAGKVMAAGYPTGFLIAPVFLYENWKEEYKEMLLKLKEEVPDKREHKLTFEVISHRYTLRAKERINEIFPENSLPMKEEDRTFKFGQFGYGKYVYSKEEIAQMKQFFMEQLTSIFPDCEVKYVI